MRTTAAQKPKGPKITPPLKWHGGKHYLADKIIKLMPPHIHYVEPYFGGGAVLLAKNPDGVSEVVNDINFRLSNFWTVLSLKECFPDFKRKVDAKPFSEVEYKHAVAWSGADDKIEDAVLFFISCRQSLAGRMDAFAPLSRTRTRRGMNEQASAWINAVDGLPAVHERLRRVVILNRDALEVIKSQDGKDTLFYLDPPYLHETRSTTGEYQHEMTEADHQKLLQTLWNVKGKFLLSGYHSKLYDKCAAGYGWKCHEFNLPNNAAGGKTKERKTECVWTNF